MRYNSYSDQEIENVENLLKNNKLSEVCRITGISRGTIRHWIGNSFIRKEKEYVVDCPEYSFILGFYLGDGHIIKNGRTQRLSLYNDMKYENINLYIENCLGVILPENKVHRINKIGCFQLTVHSNHLLDMFPQHGVGKKHTRDIILSEWQQDIIKKYPKEFIKGLIYSDGCIVYSNGYKRFEFSNRSKDIHDIFTYALEIIQVVKTSTRRRSPNKESLCYEQFLTTISKSPYIEILSDFIPDKS